MYNWKSYVDIVIHISGSIYSTFVSDLYGLMLRILCLFFIASYCNETVSLVQHCVITNVPLFGASYFYAVLLLSMTLSSILSVVFSSFTIFVDYINYFTLSFTDVSIPNPPYILLRKLYHGQIIIGPDYNISTYFLSIWFWMLSPLRFTIFSHLCRHRFC